MKRVTCFRFEQSFNIDEPFAQSVVKFAFKKDQLNALKVCYIGTWKNSNLGEWRIWQTKHFNGKWSMDVTLPMEFYTDL